ncbi:MAG: aminopeptidase P family N-terminal domain-containing protein, partial [Acidimicrobiales bacterium]
MTDAGVLALSDSGRFDPARLRAERRDRVLAGMTEDRIDALLLGTAPNIRYATGARPLWLAGARAFAPLAVVLREGETHLVGASDDGVPPEVPSDHLVSSTWNPATLMRRLAAIDGLTSARTIGVDGLT